MLYSLLIVILSSQLSWSQDQARSSSSRQRQSVIVDQYHKTTRNDYFQRDLNYLAYVKPDNDPRNLYDTINARLFRIAPNINPLINKECVSSALDNVTAGKPLKAGEKFRSNRFLKCNEQGHEFDNQDEPYYSAEYKTLVHSSFEVATTCLKEYVSGSSDKRIQNIWVEGYFKMLSTESGLHANVASRIKAIGIGQLRPEYIVDFKKRTLPRLRRFLNRTNGSTGCRKLAEELLTDEKIDNLYKTVVKTVKNAKGEEVKITDYQINTCSNINIADGQPILNLIISFANLQLFKENTVDIIFNDPKYAPVFKNLTDEELQDLEIKLVSWSYNLGAAGLRNHIVNVLHKKYLPTGKTVSTPREFIDAAAIPEKKNYVLALEDRYKLVRQNKPSCRTDIK